MAKTAATHTGYPGVEVRGNSIRAIFMFKRARHTHTLRLEPTRNNIKRVGELCDPLTYEEYLSLIGKGCLHPIAGLQGA